MAGSKNESDGRNGIFKSGTPIGSDQVPYLVIARRYRPQTFADVIGQDAIVKTVKNALITKRFSHAYLFAGSRGTGKTSLARLLAKALNCTSLTELNEPCNTCPSCKEITECRSLDVQEIDGASHRGIDHIRTLTEAAAYAPTSGQYKIYIIDEVHMLTKEAFNALLKTLEEPPASVKFFLATTEPHKIPTTIISRCQRFNLRRLSTEEIRIKLQRIIQEMGVKADGTALLRLAGYADGGLRDAESLLDQVITFSDGHVSDAAIETVLGFAPFEWFCELDEAIETANAEIAYRISDKVFYEGKDIGHFLTDLQDHYRTLLLYKLNISLPAHAVDSEREALLRKTAASFTQEHLIEIINLFAEATKALTTAASHRFLLEWLLLNLIRIKRRIPLPLIARKLIELQEKIGSAPSEVAEKQIISIPQPTTKPQKSPPKKPTEVLNIEPPPKKIPPKKSASVEKLSKEQETVREENVLQFAAVELGAALIRNNQ